MKIKYCSSALSVLILEVCDFKRKYNYLYVDITCWIRPLISPKVYFQDKEHTGQIGYATFNHLSRARTDQAAKDSYRLKSRLETFLSSNFFCWKMMKMMKLILVTNTSTWVLKQAPKSTSLLKSPFWADCWSIFVWEKEFNSCNTLGQISW